MFFAFTIATCIIIADQISKYFIFSNMKIGDSSTIIEHILNFTYVTNMGASFGMLKNHRWIFMLLSSLALIIMLFAIIYFSKKKLRKNNFMLILSLVFMFGGGIGNMIDRIKLGFVIDFIELDFVSFYVFNVADSFICIGAALLCLCIFMGKYKLKEEEMIENIENI